jgi:hypothetical protein
MPKFVIERQYLLPIYQRLIIDAPDIPEGLIERVKRGEIYAGSFLWEDQSGYGPRLDIPKVYQ